MTRYTNLEDKFIGKRANPLIPKPEGKDHAVTEILTLREKEPPVRVEEVKPLIPHQKPHFNVLYNSLGVDTALDQIADNFAFGNFTPVAAPGSVTQNIILQEPPNLSLAQWPGAISVYPCIRSFHLGSSANVNDVLQVVAYSNGGEPCPLCIFDLGNTASQNYGVQYILPTPITDPGNLNIGQIVFTTVNGSVVTPTLYWMLGISFIYVIPALKPYDMEWPNANIAHHSN